DASVFFSSAIAAGEIRRSRRRVKQTLTIGNIGLPAMNPLELILVLLVVAAGLAVAAERLKLPYPILLVLGGLGLAFIPGLPRVHIEPGLVLLLFLPPLLFSAAWFTSWRDFAANGRAI